LNDIIENIGYDYMDGRLSDKAGWVFSTNIDEAKALILKLKEISRD
jgi:hypothetical protein